eukprot:TRINITY_DN3535_c0_g1_i2.p1 TRINITY_DN3535_c0_g1~~TRINITY_DN3535_c0_g1_i2.p1  ORF type:complete len:1041 (-),score=367.97 TRINITY_DN3535_c0_g1_i2:1110-4232(-)
MPRLPHYTAAAELNAGVLCVQGQLGDSTFFDVFLEPSATLGAFKQALRSAVPGGEDLTKATVWAGKQRLELQPAQHAASLVSLGVQPHDVLTLLEYDTVAGTRPAVCFPAAVPPRSRMLLVGPAGAGKSSLFRMIASEEAKEEYIATTSTRQICCEQDDGEVLQLWDTSEDILMALGDNPLQDWNQPGCAVVVVYDNSERSSFDAAKALVAKLALHSSQATVVLLANKGDLPPAVSRYEGKVFGSELGAECFTVSAAHEEDGEALGAALQATLEVMHGEGSGGEELSRAKHFLQQGEEGAAAKCNQLWGVAACEKVLGEGLAQTLEGLATQAGDVQDLKLGLLHGAAIKGLTSVAQHLIELDVNVDRVATLGEASSGYVPVGITPLMLALQADHFAVAHLLLQAKANPDQTCINDDGNRIKAMTMAIELQDEHDGYWGIALLLQHKGNVNDTSRESGATPLRDVYESEGPGSLVDLLLEHTTHLDSRCREDGEAVLHLASTAGDEGTVRRLIEAKATLDLKDKEGRTALHRAASNLELGVARLLLEAGAKPDLRDSEKETPMDQVVVGAGDDDDRKKSKQEMIGLLLEHGAAAVLAADMDVSTQLETMDLNVQDKDGKSLLHIAAESGDKASATALLDKGANPNAQDKRGITPLMCAVDDLEMVTALLEGGASPDTQDNHGQAILHHAARLSAEHEIVEQEMQELVHMLKQHGANLDLQNKMGETPVYVSVQTGNTVLARVVLQLGADPDIPGKSGKPPLYQEMVRIKTKEDTSDMFQLLIEHKADHEGTGDVDERFTGNKLYQLAVKNGNARMIQALLQGGLDPGFRINTTTTLGHHCVKQTYSTERTKMASLLVQAQRDSGAEAKDRAGMTVLEAARDRGGNWKDWAIKFDAYLGRYNRDRIPKYQSATSQVYKAADINNKHASVALKVVHSLSAVKLEVDMRRDIDSRYVLGVLAVHVPRSVHEREEEGEFVFSEAETELVALIAEEPSEDGSYVLVMEWATASLQDEMRMKRIAGQDLATVQLIMRVMMMPQRRMC